MLGRVLNAKPEPAEHPVMSSPRYICVTVSTHSNLTNAVGPSDWRDVDDLTILRDG
jgi:hypothetical protein